MQQLICDECGEAFEVPFFQVSKPGENVQHIHPECMIWPELGNSISRDINSPGRVEIQVLIPAIYQARIMNENM